MCANGFSPDLSELLVQGQSGLSESFAATGGVVTLTTTVHACRASRWPWPRAR